MDKKYSLNLKKILFSVYGYYFLIFLMYKYIMLYPNNTDISFSMNDL